MKKENKGFVLDNWIWGIAEKHMTELMLFCLLLGSVLIRAHMAPLTFSGDYNSFLKEWYEAYREGGFWERFGKVVTEYYEPYNFLMDIFAHIPIPLWLSIAVTSCLAEYVGAWYVYRILNEIADKDENGNVSARQRTVHKFIAVGLLYLPMVMMNSALWKQCDSIYACFALISIYYLLRERYRKSFLFLAIAFVFKLQLVFLLPFYVIHYFCRKQFSVLLFLYLPILYILTGLPAVFLRRGIRTTYFMYFAQMGEDVNMLSAASPSIYRIGMKDYDSFAMPAVIITMAVLAAALAFAYQHKEIIKGRLMIYLAGWSVWTCFIFLPHMHERYDYLALIILTAFAAAYRRRILWTMIVANLCTAMTYGYFLFQQLQEWEYFTLLQIAIPYNLAYFMLTADLLKAFREEKKRSEA